MANRRLVEIWREMNHAELEFDDWVMLETVARRLERRIATHQGYPRMPLDQAEDGLAEVAAKANRPELPELRQPRVERALRLRDA